MSVLFDRLASALPERHAPRRNSFASDARSVRQWLAQLPLANPGATARLLMSALRELNQLHIDPQQRIDALELLREPIGEIVATLDKQVLGDSFPLPPLKQQIGQLAQDFEHELALGYCAAVYDLCAPAGAVPFLRGKPVALALTRAMRHRGGFLYQAYLRYHAPPAGAWQNLHDLFGFAAAVGAVDRAVSGRAGTTTSVRLAYIQALLFALSNPYRFSQRENGDIHELTRIWSTHCELREGRAPSGAIAIRTGDDHGPGYIATERRAPEADSWALEISGLVRFLEGHLALLPPGTHVTQFGSRDAPVTVATDLVGRLMHAWESGAERSQARLPASHTLDSVVGLHDLHYVLAGNADFEGFLIKTRGVAITLHEGDRAATWANNAAGAARIRRIPARVIDQSLGGYRLAWEKTEGMRLRVGELLGLAPQSDDDEARDWMVGAIRWLRIEGEGMQAGVELLARRAQPAAVRSFDTHGIPRAAMRAIALEDMDSGEMAAIVVPALFERDAGEIELTRPGDPYRWPAEPVIETLRGLRTSDGGGGYLRIELIGGAGAIESGAPQAANDDSGIPASVNGDGA
ncbi:MAG: hypothetical protein DYH18_06120 [Xanthomonadales bacterium PRO7]|jgi:hypothetical protein|nr:hypothetical protein [Xanthomonadales bacterium PRO7]